MSPWHCLKLSVPSACQQTLKQILICGDPQAKDTKALLQCVHSIYIPNKVWSLSPAPLSSSPARDPSLLQLSSISGSSEGLEKKPTSGSCWCLGGPG